jgi:hypothetical protein
MSQQVQPVEYIYDTSTYDALYAKKQRENVSILGGGSKWTSPSFKLFDGMKKMYGDPKPGSNLDGMVGVGEEGHLRRVQALTGPLGSLPHSDIEGIAAALEPPDEKRGVPKRVLISNNPEVRRLMREMGRRSFYKSRRAIRKRSSKASMLREHAKASTIPSTPAI